MVLDNYFLIKKTAFKKTRSEYIASARRFEHKIHLSDIIRVI
jgi:hypothetical protein